MKSKQPVKVEGEVKAKSSSKAPAVPQSGGAELWAVSQRAWLSRQPRAAAADGGKSASSRKSK